MELVFTMMGLLTKGVMVSLGAAYARLIVSVKEDLRIVIGTRIIIIDCVLVGLCDGGLKKRISFLEILRRET